MSRTKGHTGNKRIVDTNSCPASKATLQRAKRSLNRRQRPYQRGIVPTIQSNPEDYDDLLLDCPSDFKKH